MFFQKSGFVPDTDVFLAPEPSCQSDFRNYDISEMNENQNIISELREIKNLLKELISEVKKCQK